VLATFLVFSVGSLLHQVDPDRVGMEQGLGFRVGSLLYEVDPDKVGMEQ
jgi:hypothetical protein